jgi:hypothetical protein
MVEKNKLTDIKRADQDRRTELAMLDLLVKKYPKETVEKARRLSQTQGKRRGKSLVFRE